VYFLATSINCISHEVVRSSSKTLSLLSNADNADKILYKKVVLSHMSINSLFV
jgi:hypothetical protein